MSNGGRQQDNDGDTRRGNNTLSQGAKSTGTDSHLYGEDGLNELAQKQASSYMSGSSVVGHSVALVAVTFAALRVFN